MARGATRTAKRERSQKERRGGRQGHPPLKAALEHNGVLYESAPGDPLATAIHEAGHAVVAHAVGRRVVAATIKPELVLPGEFHRKGPWQYRNESDVLQGTYGEMLCEPRLTGEIEAQAEASLPLTFEQRQWLVEEAVLAAAGPVAEHLSVGKVANNRGDSNRLAWIAPLLGKTEQRDGRTFPDRNWGEAVQNCAATILRDCSKAVERFADELLAVREMDEVACQALLLGTFPCGSHGSLLSEPALGMISALGIGSSARQELLGYPNGESGSTK